MLARFLRLFVGRTIVRERAVPAAVDLLKGRMKEKGFTEGEHFPDSVAMVVVQEALRKAAEKESDGYARSDEFLDQIDYAADNVIAAFNGDANADSRIRSILTFHKVKSGNQLNSTSQPKHGEDQRAKS